MSALSTPDARSSVRVGPYSKTTLRATGRMSQRKRNDPAHDRFYRDLGGRIQFARESKGMSIEQLAVELDFVSSTVKNMERYGDVNLENVTALSEALDVEAHWLLHGLTEEQARLGERMAQLAKDMKAVQDLLVAG